MIIKARAQYAVIRARDRRLSGMRGLLPERTERPVSLSHSIALKIDAVRRRFARGG